MRKAFILVAMCLCALPVIMARSMSEEELLATRMLLDVPTAAMSVEEQMIMESGMYGSGSMGGYGGVLTPTTETPATSPTDAPQQTESGAITPESAPSPPASASTTAGPTPVPAQKTASSASATQISLMAGAVTAAAILLL